MGEISNLKISGKIGFFLGFILSYSIFSTILYFILTLVEKIETGAYLIVVGITFSIVVVGLIIKRLLK